MCNCGNKRNILTKTSNAAAERKPAKVNPDVNFEYNGKTGLSVTGSITGKKYRFNHPGDVQLVDYRDAPGMMMVPVLKRISKN